VRAIVKYIKMAARSYFGNMFSVVGASAFLPFLNNKLGSDEKGYISALQLEALSACQ